MNAFANVSKQNASINLIADIVLIDATKSSSTSDGQALDAYVPSEVKKYLK